MRRPFGGHDFAGGRLIETPFGNLVAPNITPDPVTGIGAWTDDEFVDALTKGTGRHGERLYPAMNGLCALNNTLDVIGAVAIAIPQLALAGADLVQ